MQSENVVTWIIDCRLIMPCKFPKGNSAWVGAWPDSVPEHRKFANIGEVDY